MKNKSLFSRFLTNKKVLFIASVVFAFIFWILTADNITKTFTEVPVKYNLPESVSQELEIFSASDEFVSVTVDGKRVAVDALSVENFLATVDLSDVTEAGEKSFNVNVKCSENLNLDISKVEPSNITLMIDRPMTKTVKLKYDFTYSPEGYYVDNNVPDTVEVSGPESYVNQVKCAYISGNVTSHNATTVTNNYKIVLYDNENPHSVDANVINNEYLKLSYNNVDVTFKYLVLKENVPFSVVTEEGIEISDLYFSTSPNSLTVAVPESALDENGEFKSIPINIGRLSQYKTDIYHLTTPLTEVIGNDIVNKTDGIEKVGLRLDFSALSSETIEVPASRCVVKNLPDGYTYNTPDKFSIVVIGTKSALNNVDPEKVDVVFDFESVIPSDDKYVDVPVAVNLNVEGFCWCYRESQTSSVLLSAE
ncbi:MAG: CdaR family protein [Ruminococcus sp.]|nr:CdaR family protein [Ruminococcus sp.]